MTKARMTGARSLRRVVAIATAALAASLVTASSAGAAENDQASVAPTSEPGNPRPFFILDLVPGVTVQDSITVINKTDAPITFDLFAADAFNTPDGAFALRGIDDPKEDLGSWIALSTDELTVPAQTSQEVPFSLSVPDNATPGDHAGGVVALAYPEGEAADDSNVALAIRQGVGARIYGRVQGPQDVGLAVTSFDLDVDSSLGSLLGGATEGQVTYTITNTGNVRITPTVDVEVSGSFGLASTSLPSRQLFELLPGGSMTVSEPATGLRAAGKLTAELTATAYDERVTATTSVWAVPWLLLAIAVVLVTVFVLWRRRRRGGRPDATPPTEPGPEPERVLVDA